MNNPGIVMLNNALNLAQGKRIVEVRDEWTDEKITVFVKFLPPHKVDRHVMALVHSVGGRCYAQCIGDREFEVVVDK